MFKEDIAHFHVIYYRKLNYSLPITIFSYLRIYRYTSALLVPTLPFNYLITIASRSIVSILSCSHSQKASFSFPLFSDGPYSTTISLCFSLFSQSSRSETSFINYLQVFSVDTTGTPAFSIDRAFCNKWFGNS